MSLFKEGDQYFSQELETFYGPKLRRSQDIMISALGHDGQCFNTDQLRRWLMNILVENGCNTFEEGVAKYPILKYEYEDELRDKDSTSD